MRQIATLEKQQIVERASNAGDDRIYRLTTKGRLHALGGRDPVERWSRHWDGQWRMVLFDIPMRQNSQRIRLRRYLKRNGFGYLQNSVWVTPNPMDEERRILTNGKIDVESLLLLEARPCAGESDREIVAGAWDFEAINRRYLKYMKIVIRRPRTPLRNNAAAIALQRWAAIERNAWLDAVTKDPLLPNCLLPHDYTGKKAWQQRVKGLRDAATIIQSFKHH